MRMPTAPGTAAAGRQGLLEDRLSAPHSTCSVRRTKQESPARCCRSVECRNQEFCLSQEPEGAGETGTSPPLGHLAENGAGLPGRRKGAGRLQDGESGAQNGREKVGPTCPSWAGRHRDLGAGGGGGDESPVPLTCRASPHGRPRPPRHPSGSPQPL